jgi:hypothetical protein
VFSDFLTSDQLKATLKKPKQKAVIASAVELTQNTELKLQMAAAVDFCHVLVMATYAVEINGPGIFITADIVELVRESLEFATKPVDAVATLVIPPNLKQVFAETALWAGTDLPRARAFIEPAYDYFKKQLAKKYKTEQRVWNACSVFAPWNASKLSDAVLKELVTLMQLSVEAAAEIVGSNEISLYKAIVEQENAIVTAKIDLAKSAAALKRAQSDAMDLDEPDPLIKAVFPFGLPTGDEFLLRNSTPALLPESRVWRFWYKYQYRLPLLTKLVRNLSALQPTSASNERSFSMYRHDVNDLAGQSSVEYKGARLRAHYNSSVDPMKNIPLDDIIPVDDD